MRLYVKPIVWLSFVGNVTFFTPCGNQALPRAYVRGLSLHDPCINPTLTGQLWEFDVLPSDHWVIRLSDEFYPPSSNHYTVSHFFDPDGSFHYTGGVPVSAFVYAGLVWLPNSQDTYVGLYCLGVQNPALRIDLPALPGYWRSFGT